jgi:hypothetical protein
MGAKGVALISAIPSFAAILPAESQALMLSTAMQPSSGLASQSYHVGFTIPCQTQHLVAIVLLGLEFG